MKLLSSPVVEALIVKQFRFEAAHQLVNHDGHCARPHGHSYLVEVALRGEVLTEPGHPKQGMVVDFGDVKDVWQRNLHSMLDHRNLNETLAELVPVTTAEYIAAFIFERMRLELSQVVGVRVWETTTGYAQAGAW